MNDDGFFVTDADGVPSGFVNYRELQAQADRITAELVRAVHNASAVTALVNERIRLLEADDFVKLILALTVIDNLVTDVLGPVMTGVEEAKVAMQQHLDTHRASRAQQPGDTSPESEPS